MHSDAPYPYMPEGKSFKYVPLENPFIEEAKNSLHLAGCSKSPNASVLVKDGKVIAKAGNGFSKGHTRTDKCKRLELGCPTGTGYEHCPNCRTEGHSESTVVNLAKEKGLDTKGADLYLYGHWWCCEPCWKNIIEAGINQVYLVKNAKAIYDSIVQDYTLQLRAK